MHSVIIHFRRNTAGLGECFEEFNLHISDLVQYDHGQPVFPSKWLVAMAVVAHNKLEGVRACHCQVSYGEDTNSEGLDPSHTLLDAQGTCWG